MEAASATVERERARIAREIVFNEEGRKVQGLEGGTSLAGQLQGPCGFEFYSRLLYECTLSHHLARQPR